MSLAYKEGWGIRDIAGLAALLLVVAISFTSIIVVVKGLTRGSVAIIDNYTSVSCDGDTLVFEKGVQTKLPYGSDMVVGYKLYLKYNKVYAEKKQSFQYKVKPGESCKLVEIPITQALKDSLSGLRK